MNFCKKLLHLVTIGILFANAIVAVINENYHSFHGWIITVFFCFALCTIHNQSQNT